MTHGVEAGATLGRLRSTFESGVTRPLTWRTDQLRGMVRLLVENEEELSEALAADVGKPRVEGWLTDLAVTRLELEHAIKELPIWMRPERVKVPMIERPGKATIHREPVGVALVIAPWNYPIQLLLEPMGAALAAGNCVVGKPSELAPATSSALFDLLPQYLYPDATAIVEGGVAETTELLAQRWDHIFYTGNGVVGRVVARAAAEHLTPVTLELGGKSPAIVDADADLKVAAKRIAWGKWLNAGQTCVAPDHLLVHERVADELLERIVAATRSFYGDDPQASPDYARIVNDRHFDRLAGLLDDGGHTVAHGGERDRDERYLAPTILTEVQPAAAVMADEIFGPILPVLRVSDVDEAIERVNCGDKPLALYAFTGSHATADRIVARTSSGGVCINATVHQLNVPALPFGGVGASGTGSYHGGWGFETFSHRKAVLSKPTQLDPPITYPPFSAWKERVLRKLL